MVTHSRTRPDPLRPLNRPRPLQVACNARGEPAVVSLRGRQERVAAVKDRWRLEDEWWRRPIRRTYYLVELEEGGLLTLYHDHEEDRWYRQRERVRPPAAPVGDGRVH